MSVDHIVPKKQGYFQAGLHGHILEHTGVLRGVGIENGAAGAAEDILFIVFLHEWTGNVHIAGEQVELADLFIEGHALQQTGQEALLLRVGRAVKQQ